MRLTVPIPPYVADLRRHLGPDLLLLPGVSGVVVRELEGQQQVLLVRRSDNGEWSLPSGIVEPFEQPGDCLVREVREETCVEARVDRLALLVTDPETRYPNGDRCCYLAMTFRASYLSGEAEVGDEESVEVGWFGLDALPELSPRMRRRLEVGLPERGETVFETGYPTGR